MLINALLLPVLMAESEQPDTTVFLPSVSIHARKISDYGQGHFTTSIDQSTLGLLNNQDLGSALQMHSGMFIRTYGASGLATNALRGGAAGQTAILWNGVNLNSPMNGHTDLSLLPSFFFDQVMVQHGGSSALWGSSAMGGAIFLNNHAASQKGFSAEVGFVAGTQGELTQTVRAGYSGSNFSSTFRFMHRENENNYYFPNFSELDVPSQQQLNARMNQIGIMHETWVRLGRNHQIDFQWWWQDNHRNIAPPTNFPTFLSLQEDESLRLSLQYTFNQPNFTYFAQVARMQESILYSDAFSPELLYDFVLNVGQTEVRYSRSKNFLFTAGANFQNTTAEAKEYEKPIERNTAALFLSANWLPFDESLSIIANLRQEFVAQYEIPLTPSLGISYKALPGWHIRGNAGYSFRLPSLNDKYWIPGGNPLLKPEEGWNFDLRMEHIVSEIGEFAKERFLERLSIGGYYREIQNWILWLPQNDSWLWAPENRAEVKSYGLETLASGSQRWNNFRFSWVARYEHSVARNMVETSPQNPSLGKQLIYVPRNRAGISIGMEYQNFSVHYSHDFTGKSYTNSSNTQYLPAFSVGNISVSHGFSFAGYILRASLSAENLWNSKYQIMANRPMPFRIIRAGVHLSVNR